MLGYNRKLARLMDLERRQGTMQRQAQSADNALTLVHIAYEIDMLKAEMAIERLQKERELFEAFRQCGSMRAPLIPSLRMNMRQWTPDGGPAQIIEGRPILTGDPIRDIWAVRDEAQRIAEIVLTS